MTDCTKSYAVFTYNCGNMDWSYAAIIGFNTPTDFRMNHALSGTDFGAEIACLHLQTDLNNVIYNLQISAVILPTTPAPSSFLGIQQHMFCMKES